MHETAQTASGGFQDWYLGGHPKLPVPCLHPRRWFPPPLPSAVPCVTPHRRTCGWWAESTAARDLEESGFAGLFLVFSQPLHGQVFSAESTQKGPCPPPRGGAACCSCSRCSWARWPASVLWEPRAPAAREFWANAQPWHSPLSH